MITNIQLARVTDGYTHTLPLSSVEVITVVKFLEFMTEVVVINILHDITHIIVRSIKQNCLILRQHKLVGLSLSATLSLSLPLL